jgi:glycosyltransferase involved in cell wall biosynthesis
MTSGKTGTRGKPRPLAVLLDLSGDKNAATQWAATRLADATVTQITKADLKWASRRKALAHVRSLALDVFSVFTSDLSTQSGVGALMLFGVLAGASRVTIGDGNGRVISRSLPGVILFEAPRFVLELLAGYVLLIPLSWLLTELLGVALLFRGVVRASRIKGQGDGPRSCNTLYIRATIAGGAQGGMRTHVAGFASGAAALGRRLTFVESGAQPDDGLNINIPPSRTFDADKALYELWNNFNFTVRSLRLFLGDVPNEIDFIYQRYSRFNWTGVALSIVTGLPLMLEFNGSEVWVSKQWDPIRQHWLLRRFERLNQRGADLIFVVSDVERRNLIDGRVRSAKIVVNPNGVDTDRFKPELGGREVRRALGVQDKIVVGFVGTFGPWHGAPVLAEAARAVQPAARFHFLFIGDGDGRAETESIIEAAGANATFTGRVSHDQVPAYLDACDILVSPHVPSVDGSEFFGSPTKLFEYMAMAKPIVASRLGQIAEVISDRENGLLVPPGDSGALARAIEKLAEDEEMRARLGVAARQTVIDRYTWLHNARRVFNAAACSEVES